jgi:hypothetical protein
MGGMARRVTAIREFMRTRGEQSLLIVETGNALRQTDNLAEPANRWVLEAFNLAGLHAVHTTVADWRRLERMVEVGKVPEKLEAAYIASMIEPAPGARFPIKPFVVQTLVPRAGGDEVRIGVLAVSAATGDSPASGRVTGAEEALRKWIPEVDAQSDLVVLLARMSDPELSRTAQMFPAIDIIINGNSVGEGRDLPKVGETRIVESAHGGIALGILEVEWDAAGRVVNAKNQHIPLHPLITSEPEMLRLQEKAHQELVTFLEAEARKAPPVTMPSIFAGSKACKDCHEKAYAVWSKSKHAHSIDVLKATSDHYNDACLECHVTGFGVGRGFVNVLRTPDLANIHCEACHGASVDHARDPANTHPGLGLLQTQRRRVRQEFCVRCHTHENSPKFNFEAYWKKIEH